MSNKLSSSDALLLDSSSQVERKLIRGQRLRLLLVLLNKTCKANLPTGECVWMDEGIDEGMDRCVDEWMEG